MSAAIDLEWTIIVGTMVFLLMIGFIVVLLLLNNNRRIRHRIEMAEADLRRQQEVRSAEREATEQTLGEIGRELHDSVGQLLTVAQMGFVERLEGAWHDDPKVATAVGALEEGIAEVRRLGRSLNTDLWKERSLVDALEAEAVRIERIGSLVDALEAEAVRIERIGRGRVLLTVDGDPADPPADVKTVLFRTFQEVMNNALKHSGADTMEIGLSGDRLPVLRIADNGRGFDPARVATGGGLLNIRRRCALIGYHADLVTGPGIGCMWTLKPQHE